MKPLVFHQNIVPLLYLFRYLQFVRYVIIASRSLPYDIMCRMFYLLLNIPAYYRETKSLFASGSTYRFYMYAVLVHVVRTFLPPIA